MRQKGFTSRRGRSRILRGVDLTSRVSGTLDGFNTFVQHNAGALALTSGFVAVVALALGVLASWRLRAISRPFQWLSGRGDGELDSLPALLQTVEKNARDVEAVRVAVEAVESRSRSHFNRIGLVRYDAFDGVAGQQSYSLCLLDDHHSGFVLSNLVGANFSRSYALEIAGGEAPRKLGEEESRALSLALHRVEE